MIYVCWFVFLVFIDTNQQSRLSLKLTSNDPWIALSIWISANFLRLCSLETASIRIFRWFALYAFGLLKCGADVIVATIYIARFTLLICDANILRSGVQIRFTASFNFRTVQKPSVALVWFLVIRTIFALSWLCCFTRISITLVALEPLLVVTACSGTSYARFVGQAVALYLFGIGLECRQTVTFQLSVI